MLYQNRQYQVDCVNAWISSFEKPCTPVIAVPTGAGKTHIMCGFIYKWLEKNPDHNILVLSHTKEILEQDYEALIEYFPPFGVGLYSAGLDLKQIRKITVGGIHSVYSVPEYFKKFDLVIIDEVHAVNTRNIGMYRQFLHEIHAKITGMSATVFRTGYGYIYEGKDALFDTLAYDLTSVSAFNKLVDDGYLTNLISKETDFELDSSDIKKTAADYNVKDLARKHDTVSTTEQAVTELIRMGKNYKKWLVFAIDITHANNICAFMNKMGVKTGVLHTKIKDDRSNVITDFKEGNTRALVSVGMITTGFDAPNVDLIALLRPTLSPVLHVQMVGRGLRTYPGKDHCLVLDFAGNTARLGPINNPVVRTKRNNGKGSKNNEMEAPTKTCPRCKVIASARQSRCKVCGYVFPLVQKIKIKPDGTPIIQKNDTADDWIPVRDVQYFLHVKTGSPTSLRVSYLTSLGMIYEWVCLDHKGFAKRKADRWVQRRDPSCQIFTTGHVFLRRNKLQQPTHIKVKRRKGTSYYDIKEQKFGAN